MRKYIQIPDAENESFQIMSGYAFSLEPQVPKDPEQPFALWRGVEVHGQLVAGAGLYPLPVRLKGATINLGGIGSVATWPQHRRQGNVSWLLTEILREMRERKLFLSALWPFNWQFYRRFGWELATTALSAEVKTSELATLPEPDCGQGELFDGDHGALEAVHTKMAEEYQLHCLRTAKWLRIALKPWGKKAVTWCWRENNGITGYFTCSQDKEKLVVHDIFWASANAMWGMFRLLANHDAQAEKVAFRQLPSNHPLPILLGDQYQDFRLKPLIMARIVDVERLLAALDWPIVSGRICLQVADRHAPWNNGMFTLSFTEGSCAVSRNGGRPDLELGIEQLTQLVTGYTGPQTLNAGKKITMHAQHMLINTLFPLHTPFFGERF
ncbi:MAG: GNAT family N-acetyltransferase [Firmicutes bacterium]|nr:GNAT family N-acetyltransferase [Bacillota bacterium]